MFIDHCTGGSHHYNRMVCENTQSSKQSRFTLSDILGRNGALSGFTVAFSGLAAWVVILLLKGPKRALFFK